MNGTPLLAEFQFWQCFFWRERVAASRRLSITRFAPVSKLRLELRQLGGISKKDLILDIISQRYLNIPPIIRTLSQSRA